MADHRDVGSEEESKGDSYESNVNKLIHKWATLCICKGEPLLPKTQCLFRETARMILSASWSSVKPLHKSQLTLVLHSTIKTVARTCTESISLINTLSELTVDPWGNPALTAILNSDCNNLEEIALHKYYCETANSEVMCLRLEMLEETQCQDLALKLCLCCLHCSPFQSDPRLKEMQLRLFFQLGKIGQLTKELSNYSCEMGLDLIARALQLQNNISVRYAECLLHIFLVRDLTTQSDYHYTKELMDMWVDVQMKLNVKKTQLLQYVMKLSSLFTTSAHYYLMVNILFRKFGKYLLRLYVDLFIKALTVDLNFLENARLTLPFTEVVDAEQHFANMLRKLAALLEDHSLLARECLLTAFSVDPSEERFKQLEAFAVTKQSSTKMVSSKFGGIVAEPCSGVCHCEEEGACQRLLHKHGTLVPSNVDSTEWKYAPSHIHEIHEPASGLVATESKHVEGSEREIVDAEICNAVKNIIGSMLDVLSTDASTNPIAAAASSSLRSKGRGSSPTDIYNATNFVLDQITEELPSDTLQDLTIVLDEPRNKIFSWELGWAELKSHCKLYLETKLALRTMAANVEDQGRIFTTMPEEECTNPEGVPIDGCPNVEEKLVKEVVGEPQESLLKKDEKVHLDSNVGKQHSFLKAALTRKSLIKLVKVDDLKLKNEVTPLEETNDIPKSSSTETLISASTHTVLSKAGLTLKHLNPTVVISHSDIVDAEKLLSNENVDSVNSGETTIGNSPTKSTVKYSSSNPTLTPGSVMWSKNDAINVCKATTSSSMAISESGEGNAKQMLLISNGVCNQKTERKSNPLAIVAFQSSDNRLQTVETLNSACTDRNENTSTTIGSISPDKIGALKPQVHLNHLRFVHHKGSVICNQQSQRPSGVLLLHPPSATDHSITLSKSPLPTSHEPLTTPVVKSATNLSPRTVKSLSAAVRLASVRKSNMLQHPIFVPSKAIERDKSGRFIASPKKTGTTQQCGPAKPPTCPNTMTSELGDQSRSVSVSNSEPSLQPSLQCQPTIKHTNASVLLRQVRKPVGAQAEEVIALNSQLNLQQGVFRAIQLQNQSNVSSSSRKAFEESNMQQLIVEGRKLLSNETVTLYSESGTASTNFEPSKNFESSYKMLLSSNKPPVDEKDSKSTQSATPTLQLLQSRQPQTALLVHMQQPSASVQFQLADDNSHSVSEEISSAPDGGSVCQGRVDAHPPVIVAKVQEPDFYIDRKSKHFHSRNDGPKWVSVRNQHGGMEYRKAKNGGKESSVRRRCSSKSSAERSLLKQMAVCQPATPGSSLDVESPTKVNVGEENSKTLNVSNFCIQADSRSQPDNLTVCSGATAPAPVKRRKSAKPKDQKCKSFSLTSENGNMKLVPVTSSVMHYHQNSNVVANVINGVMYSPGIAAATATAQQFLRPNSNDIVNVSSTNFCRPPDLIAANLTAVATNSQSACVPYGTTNSSALPKTISRKSNCLSNSVYLAADSTLTSQAANTLTENALADNGESCPSFSQNLRLNPMPSNDGTSSPPPQSFDAIGTTYHGFVCESADRCSTNQERNNVKSVHRFDYMMATKMTSSSATEIVKRVDYAPISKTHAALSPFPPMSPEQLTASITQLNNPRGLKPESKGKKKKKSDTASPQKTSKPNNPSGHSKPKTANDKCCCPVCDHRLSSPFSLKRHLKSVHKLSEPFVSDVGRLASLTTEPEVKKSIDSDQPKQIEHKSKPVEPFQESNEVFIPWRCNVNNANGNNTGIVNRLPTSGLVAKPLETGLSLFSDPPIGDGVHLLGDMADGGSKRKRECESNTCKNNNSNGQHAIANRDGPMVDNFVYCTDDNNRQMGNAKSTILERFSYTEKEIGKAWEYRDVSQENASSDDKAAASVVQRTDWGKQDNEVTASTDDSASESSRTTSAATGRTRTRNTQSSNKRCACCETSVSSSPKKFRSATDSTTRSLRHVRMSSLRLGEIQGGEVRRTRSIHRR